MWTHRTREANGLSEEAPVPAVRSLIQVCCIRVDTPVPTNRIPPVHSPITQFFAVGISATSTPFLLSTVNRFSSMNLGSGSLFSIRSNVRIRHTKT